MFYIFNTVQFSVRGATHLTGMGEGTDALSEQNDISALWFPWLPAHMNCISHTSHQERTKGNGRINGIRMSQKWKSGDRHGFKGTAFVTSRTPCAGSRPHQRRRGWESWEQNQYLGGSVAGRAVGTFGHSQRRSPQPLPHLVQMPGRLTRHLHL